MTEKSKTRQGRVNRQQLEAFISHLEQHPYMATGKFNTMNANINMQEKWEQLSEYLNSLATDGKKKDVKSWKTTWRDLKSKVSEKVQKLRQAKSRTGNNPITIFLSEFDKRILGIIGHDYIQGLTNVPDSFPEENCNAVEELASGSTDVLNIPPAPIVIPEINDNDNYIEVSNEDGILITVENERVLKVLNNNDDSVDDEPVAMENIGSTELRNEMPNVQRTTPKSDYRNNSKRLAVQFSEAREVFQEIANKQADAMKMLAEATLGISEAINKMAQNEDRQTHLLEFIYKKLDK